MCHAATSKFGFLDDYDILKLTKVKVQQEILSCAILRAISSPLIVHKHISLFEAVKISP